MGIWSQVPLTISVSFTPSHCDRCFFQPPRGSIMNFHLLLRMFLSLNVAPLSWGCSACTTYPTDTAALRLFPSTLIGLQCTVFSRKKKGRKRKWSTGCRGKWPNTLRARKTRWKGYKKYQSTLQSGTQRTQARPGDFVGRDELEHWK